MQTKIFSISHAKIDQNQIRQAAQILKNGGLVCFPTETVYGLGANSFLEDSVKNIFTVKGRPADNPLIVHISDVDMLDGLTAEIPACAKPLMEQFWPGPLTLLFRKSNRIPDIVTAGLPTVGIRMPDHEIARSLIRAAGVPVCAPSANLSTKPSPTNFSHAYDDLNGKIEAIIDGGPCRIGVESTVLDISEDKCEILRPGGITLEQIQKIVPNASIGVPRPGESPKAPGMKYRHYSPAAVLYVVRGDHDAVSAYINQKADKHSVILAFSKHLRDYPRKTVWSLGDDQDLSQAANRLFSYFRQADKQGFDTIYCEDIEAEKGLAITVKNRLYKASKDVIIV
jgi:L-threonylcarbamoyladenylate synthase